MIEIKTIWIEVSLDLICDVVMKNVHPCPAQQNTSVYFVGRRVFCLSKKHRFCAEPRSSVSVLAASFSLTPKTSLLWQDVSGFKQYRVAAIYNIHAVNCLARWYVLTAGKCGTLIRRDKGAGTAGVWKAYCIGDTDKRVGADDNKGM